MTYELAIGDRLFSSWSLRGRLLFSKFGINVSVKHARMYSSAFDALRADFAPTRTVPALKINETVIWDSLAIAETLAERHPDKGFWPKDEMARAIARSITAEMHSGFPAFRSNCPMDIRHIYTDFEAPADVLADVERIEMLCEHARSFATEGPWLFGEYSIADAFYAPVVMRLVTYGLVHSDFSKAYVSAHLADLAFRQWRAMGFAENFQQTVYDKDLTKAEWPGPVDSGASPIDASSAENEFCPYSGEPVTHFLKYKGKVWGFCNAFCRDKTVADAGAWPAFQDLVNQG